MSRRRIQRRLPSSEFYTTGKLAQYSLQFDKRGQDGSAKCNIVNTQSESDAVFGVIYRIRKDDFPLLESIEGPGYVATGVEVNTQKNKILSVITFSAIDIDSTLRPFAWYLQHVLTGAQEHQLPVDYIDMIRNVATDSDPVRERHDQELRIYQ